MSIDPAQRLRGFLWGAAVGDALGGIVNDLSVDQIRTRFGPRMLQDLVADGNGLGAASKHTSCCCSRASRSSAAPSAATATASPRASLKYLIAPTPAGCAPKG
jgi:ADP-ribosylglycohydrolase